MRKLVRDSVPIFDNDFNMMKVISYRQQTQVITNVNNRSAKLLSQLGQFPREVFEQLPSRGAMRLGVR
jgi:hypothetical protein